MCTVLIRASSGGFSTMRPFNEKMCAGKGRKWRGSIKEKKPAAKRNLTPPPPERLPQTMRSNRTQRPDPPTLERLASGTDDTLSCGGLAPWAPFRATRCIIDKRTREPFADQDFARRSSQERSRQRWSCLRSNCDIKIGRAHV